MNVLLRISGSLLLFSFIIVSGCKTNRIDPYLHRDFAIKISTSINGPQIYKNKRVLIFADGTVKCNIAITNGNNGKYSTKDFQFKLTDTQKKAIWNSIDENNFFSLNHEYIDRRVADGSSVSITVKTDSKSHTVFVENYEQNNFENIIKTINTFLPEEYQF